MKSSLVTKKVHSMWPSQTFWRNETQVQEEKKSIEEHMPNKKIGNETKNYEKKNSKESCLETKSRGGSKGHVKETKI